MQILFDFFSYALVFFSVVLPVLYCSRYNKFGSAYKYFTIYLGIVAIIQVAMLLYATQKWNNLFMSHFYMIGQFVLLSLFYKALLRKRFITWVLWIVLVGLGISYILNPTVFFKFHTYGMSITQIILALYALGYFYTSLLKERPFLLLNTGVFAYILTSTLYYASYNLVLLLELPVDIDYYLSVVNNVLYFVFQLLIFLEWYRNYKVTKTHS